MTSIEKILKDKGPLLSSDLLRIIESQNPEISSDAVRKRLSRIKSPVKRLFGFFADNQILYYLDEDYRTELFYTRLSEAISKAAKRMDAYLAALEFHHGYLDSAYMATYGFCPVEKLRGNKLYQSYEDLLFQFNFIRKVDNCFALSNDLNLNGGSDFKKYKAEETARNLVLSQFMSWARSIGLISYNTGTFYSNFGKFQWCFTSPAYVNGIREFKDNAVKPFFVVADVLIGKEVTERNVNYFIEKVKILNAQKNLSRVMPILILESAHEGAFRLLKENGIVVGLVNKLFGREYAELLGALVNTILNAGAILKKNPDQFLDLIRRIDKLVEGKTINLRGDLFELAVGYYHKHSLSLDIGKGINLKDGPVEIDVFAVYRDKIVVAECKGYKSKITLADVDDWLTKLSKVRNWMQDIEPYREKQLVGEYWSTGGFEDDALSKITNASEKTKKYKIEYYDQAGILVKFRELKSKRVLDTLKQYFFNEEL